MKTMKRNHDDALLSDEQIRRIVRVLARESDPDSLNDHFVNEVNDAIHEINGIVEAPDDYYDAVSQLVIEACDKYQLWN